MSHRNLLHKSKLDEFQLWCRANNIATRPGKGDYQVLQVLTPRSGWQVVFRKNDMPEHLTVNAALEPLVREFISAERPRA